MLLLICLNILALNLSSTVISQRQTSPTTIHWFTAQTDPPTSAIQTFTEATLRPPTQQGTTPGSRSLTSPKPPCKCHGFISLKVLNIVSIYTTILILLAIGDFILTVLFQFQGIWSFNITTRMLVPRTFLTS